MRALRLPRGKVISSKVSQLASGTQVGLKTSLLFDFGPRTHSAHPAASCPSSPPQKLKGGRCCSPRRRVTFVPFRSGTSRGQGQVMPGFWRGQSMLQLPNRGVWPRKGALKSWECQGHEEMSYLQFLPHRPLRNGIMACATCL